MVQQKSMKDIGTAGMQWGVLGGCASEALPDAVIAGVVPSFAGPVGKDSVPAGAPNLKAPESNVPL